MDKLVHIHHTLSDWTFKTGQGLHISTVRYISPPSSLCLSSIDGGFHNAWVLLKDALGLCIPEGRFITQIFPRHGGAALLYVYLRAQDVPTVLFPNNCYWLYIIGTTVNPYRRVNSVDTDLGQKTFTGAFLPNVWTHWRITFWNYLGTDLVTVLRITVERYQAGAWALLATINDPVNKWADSATNRIGFQFAGSDAPYITNIDDTEIWKRIT